MKRTLIAKTVGFAGLIGLLNFSDVNAEEKFSLSGSLGAYSPFGDVVALNGIPYGFEIDGDYGNERYGARIGGGWFTKFGDRRGEFGLIGKNLVEGEQERAELTRFYGGLRFGNRYTYIGIGGVAMEGSNIFEAADRKFLRQELKRSIDRKSLHGIYGEVSVGAPVKKNKKTGVFFRGTYDHFFDSDKSKGIKLSVGVTFSQ
ncbi:hypothetical protein HYV89_02915 [Candidatus Woesearchaeota archaeon]|nr:hypothetical protein [Candidatus Woesearchaeota archaeon]